MPPESPQEAFWACELCGTGLGRWEKNKDLFNEHIEQCQKGDDEIEKRYHLSKGAKLRTLLRKGIVGPKVQKGDDNDEIREYDSTSEERLFG